MKFYFARKEYDYDFLATVWNIYSMDVERIDSVGEREFCDVPEKEVEQKVRELNVFFVGPGEYPDFDEWPSFSEWLLIRYHTTRKVLKEVAENTSNWREYDAAMDWYFTRYFLEKYTWEELKAANPF